MILGRVVGEVWGARRHALLDGRKLVLVRPYYWYDPAHETDLLVAADPVGAGVGDDVVVCLGDGARRSLGAANLPIEAAILGIVDSVEAAGSLGLRPLEPIGGRHPFAASRPGSGSGE